MVPACPKCRWLDGRQPQCSDAETPEFARSKLGARSLGHPPGERWKCRALPSTCRGWGSGRNNTIPAWPSMSCYNRGKRLKRDSHPPKDTSTGPGARPLSWMAPCSGEESPRWESVLGTPGPENAGSHLPLPQRALQMVGSHLPAGKLGLGSARPPHRPHRPALPSQGLLAPVAECSPSLRRESQAARGHTLGPASSPRIPGLWGELGSGAFRDPAPRCPAPPGEGCCVGAAGNLEPESRAAPRVLRPRVSAPCGV